MEGISELIPFLVERGTSTLWDDFLKTCKELKIFAKKSTELVPLLNSLLNEPHTRCFGLKILDVYLTQCPKSIINEHISNWFNQTLKGATQSTDNISCLSFTILQKLLEESIAFPDVRKQTSQVVPKILDIVVDILNDNSRKNASVFHCLIACLSFYGKASGNHRDSLEKILVASIIQENASDALLSKCYNLLAQVGPPGINLVNYQENWHSKFLTVTNSLHAVLDQLFCDVGEILGSYGRCAEKQILDLPTISGEFPLVKCHKLGILFSGLCQFVESMLLDKFPASKKIVPEAIFGVCCRALAVTFKSLESKISNSTYAVMTQISSVHYSVIKMLNSLILCSQTRLLPFSPLICKIFTQIFKSTDVDSWLSGHEKPFARVRASSYKCLLTWLSVCKSCSLSEALGNVISIAIIKDVRCEKKAVRLNLEQKTKSKNSKKITITETFELLEINADVCLAALACIPFILRSPLSFTVVKNLQEVVVKLIFEIQRLSKYDSNFPPPYSNPNCRASLYSALLALCILPHPLFPPPLHYANILFNKASLDSDVNVHRICSNAVSSISHLLRPCAPSFDFHVELDSDVIPINPYPEPSCKEIKGISDKLINEFLLSKKNEQNKSVQTRRQKIMQNEKENPSDESSFTFDVDASLPSTSKAINSNIDKKTSLNNGSFEKSIDIDNSSSDESLILVNPKSKGNCKSSIANNTNEDDEILILKSRRKQMESNESEDLIIPLDGPSLRSTRKSGFQNDPDIELIEKEDFSKTRSKSDSEDVQLVADNIKISDSKNKTDSEDIVILESLVGDKADKIDKSCEHHKRTRSGRSSRHENVEDNFSAPNTSKCDIIDLDEEPARTIRTRSSKALSVLDSIDLDKITNKNDTSKKDTNQDSNNADVETQISEELSIIESSFSQQTPKRKGHSSLHSKKFSVEEITLIPDEDEPFIKKSKSNTNSTNHRNKENDINICEIDADDEMMNSFVDSVPD